MSRHLTTGADAPHSLKILICAFSLLISILTFAPAGEAQKRRGFIGRGFAVVVDERLAVLRDKPDLNSRLVRRLGRGRPVTIIGAGRSPDGVDFYRVAVTRRTRGWLQVESVASPARRGDDEKLLRLIRTSEDFDRIARARIFLDVFPASTFRPTVLQLYGDAAEEAAAKLSADAGRRLSKEVMAAGGASAHSYFMNYNGLDRYARQGITFVFDRAARAFHYEGKCWREILRRYPRSPEAETARQRLAALSTVSAR